MEHNFSDESNLKQGKYGWMDSIHLYGESRNDDYKYAQIATQEDFDRF